MSLLSLPKCFLVILVFSICILQSCGKDDRVGRESRSPRGSYSRSTVQQGVLGYYIWGSPHETTYKRGMSSKEYPFLSSRKEYYEPVTDYSQADLESMPTHYRRIVESGSHLEDFKEYYLTDLYLEDMNEIAAKKQAMMDTAREEK